MRILSWVTLSQHTQPSEFTQLHPIHESIDLSTHIQALAGVLSFKSQGIAVLQDMSGSLLGFISNIGICKGKKGKMV